MREAYLNKSTLERVLFKGWDDMIAFNDVKDFWEYLIFYPYEDDEDYDGIHDGGIKGILEDAPNEAKQAFLQYKKRKQKLKKSVLNYKKAPNGGAFFNARK